MPKNNGELAMGEDGVFTIQHIRGGGADEPKSVTFSRAVIIVINLLTSLGGLALAGVGIYVYIEFNTRFSGLLSENAAIGGIVAGVLISMMACFGIYGTATSNFKVLVFYAIVSLALLITILSVLGLFVEYIGTVSQVASGGLTVFNQRQIEVNDFFASAYTKCCVQNTLFCYSSVPNTDGYCPPVPYCVNRTATEVCYAGEYGATPNDPPKLVFQEFCGTLIAFGMAGPALPSTGACGAPNGAAGFMQTVFGWVNANVQYPYICIGLLSGIIFFEVLFTIYLARYIYLVNAGLWDDTPAPKFKSSKKKKGAVNDDEAVVSIADQFRFNEDEFDATLREGISATDHGSKSHKSGRYSSGNPIFRSLFPKKKPEPIPDAFPVDDV